MNIRTVTAKEIMRRIANGDSMDNYQVIHKLKLFTGEYVIQNVAMDRFAAEEYPEE